MADQTDIDDAVMTYIIDEFLPIYPISFSYPNADFTPVLEEEYIDVQVLHGETYQKIIGENSYDRCPGVIQFVISIQSGVGDYTCKEWVANLKEYFKRGTVIVGSSFSIRVQKFYLGGTDDTDTPWYRKTVNVQFEADLPN